MISAFIGAWEDGNVYRMVQLSSSSIASKVNKLPQPSSTTQTPDTLTVPGHTIITVDAAGSAIIVFDVAKTKLGHSHAIALVSITAY